MREATKSKDMSHDETKIDPRREEAIRKRSNAEETQHERIFLTNRIGFIIARDLSFESSRLRRAPLLFHILLLIS